MASTQGSIRTSATTDRMRLSTQRSSLNAMEDILADETLGRGKLYYFILDTPFLSDNG